MSKNIITTTTRLVGGENEGFELDEVQIKVTKGPERGLVVDLNVNSLRIGSSPDNEIVLHDPTVSGRHAEIQVTTRGYFVRDLGSKNGVKINSVFVERARLDDGMRLHMGDSVLIVRSLGTKRNVSLAKSGQLGSLVAKSVKMRAVVAEILALAKSNVTVIIEGETGTGKEVAARALHLASPRALKPLVIFDCGATNPNLVSSEIFGHEKGAFSGANESREGALERAHRGTLFLDEIGELPLDVQTVFLRAIEQKSGRRIGGSRYVSYDVRIVAATNRNLLEEVRAGRFREDLYHRLAVGRIRLPPLRERLEDIPDLVRTFAAEFDAVIHPENEALMASYSWPGNIRELRNTIARAAALKTQPAPPQKPAPKSVEPMQEARRQAMEEFERSYLEDVLKLSDGNISKAAKIAGVSRQVMTRIAARHNLRQRDRHSKDSQ